MAQAGAGQKPALTKSSPKGQPGCPSGDAISGAAISGAAIDHLLPPGLATQTPKELLCALPGRLDCYLDLLCSWNKAINLTGARDRTTILERLIPDSFQLAAFLRESPLAMAAGKGSPEIWDLGAGAGLPGIPLRMVWNEGKYTLVEARQKRAIFLANALAALGLERTSVFRGPAEQLFAAQPQGADIIISRAFLPLPKLLPFCRPMLRPGAVLIIFAASAAGELPAPWQTMAQRAYDVQGSKRWLWALQDSCATRESGHA